MSKGGTNNAFITINDFSRQLFLIKTPSDFHKGLADAFHKVLPDIELFIMFRYHWEDHSFSVISSNYLRHINDIQLDRKKLETMLHEIIRKQSSIYNANLEQKRDGDILRLFNTSKSGAEIIFPLIPVNDPVGILYAYSRKQRYFDGQSNETIKLIGHMASRTWNMITYQAHQIKSHKKAELEIINQKNLMNEIFDYLPINIFTKDKEGKFIYLNKNAEESTGISVKDAIGKSVYEIYSEETAKMFDADDIEVRKTKQPKISHHEIEIKGRKRHVFTGKKIIHTSENKELLIGFSVDITQNIQASRAIEEQKKFYQQIFNTVPNYIYIKDKNGRFILVNEAVAELFQLSQEQILLHGSINPSNLKVDIALNAEIDKKVLATGKSFEFEEYLVLHNGEERWYHTTKKPLPDKDGVVNILGISVDITERKKHSDELLKAKQTKEQFLANMSHEIRTPINGVVGMVNLLEEIPATEEQKKYLNAIKTSSKNLQVIINDILDLSAIESGNIKFERIGFNLKSFFNTLISSFSYSAKQKGISITLNFDPYIDEVVIGDPVRLNQIISNLIGNAVKFTKRGFVKIYALKIGQEGDMGDFQFIVDDSGIGIADEKIQKIFENFEQGDETINRKYGGTGLGLAIVKQLVESQNGSIVVQSRPGRGSKFTVNLSFEIGSEQDLEESKSPVAKFETTGKKLDLSKHKILLVEDNEVNLLYTKKILQNWNCAPDEAKNGLTALEKLKENSYDLILMDVRMPIMDGFEATKFIRTNFAPPKSNTPIIALTANAIKGDEDKCIAAGMNDYISKPFQPETLKNKIIGSIELEGFTKKIPNKPKGDTYNNKTIDLTYLKEMSDNDQGFIHDMVKSFINQAPRDIENIWFHFASEEYDDLANIIHKIKPSVTFMGIHALKDLVLSIEDNAKSRRIEPLKDQLDKFEHICRMAITELKEEFALA
ncbi:MAG: PAS domain S-box protein [Cyclobacteriaceae bacterium]|nr:PAS domain S-box protein [Cyclobacteriaceae bacterium]